LASVRELRRRRGGEMARRRPRRLRRGIISPLPLTSLPRALDPRQESPYLIVNADDLGMTEGVNRAIFTAHANGIVTNTSLMAVGNAFDHAVRGAREHPTLGIGVHLCLHDEKPVLDRSKIPSLVATDGHMPPLSLAVRRIVLGKLDPNEIEAEYSAQVSRIRDAGIDITHLDSHCHLHAFPSIARAVRRVAAKFGIQCLRRAESLRPSDYLHSPPGRYPVSMLITSMSLLSYVGVHPTWCSPDRFVGMVRSGTVDADWIVRVVRSLVPGRVTELMVHPGDGSALYGNENDHGPTQRKVEWEAVTSPAVLDAVRERGVKLVSYRHLLGRA
jgi:predicted glycoside hydrolase/deacetylase ChbG (UPF0249 family)